MPRGFVFRGITGTGKSSTARLLARALMCTGTNPLGCKVSTGSLLDVHICGSCRTVDQDGLESHPDFYMVDGAAKRGVDDSREIMVTAESLPVLGKRRVTMLDEAHCLTEEAWKIYLTPLEKANSDATFEFVSNRAELIPKEILSRCCCTKFGRVDDSVILGLLANIAHTNSLKADQDALKAITAVSKGIVRDAVQLLSTVASMGDITKQLVLSVVDLEMEDFCLKVLSSLAKNKVKEAIELADKACLDNPPNKFIEALFSGYARAIFPQEEDPFLGYYGPIREGLPDISGLTTVFLRWSTVSRLSSDVIPIFITELNQVQVSPAPVSQVRGRSRPASVEESKPQIKSSREVMEFLGAKEK